MCGLASDGILTMMILKCNCISIDAYIATCIAFPSHLSAQTIMLRGISQLLAVSSILLSQLYSRTTVLEIPSASR